MRDLNTGGRAGSCDVITQIRDYGGVIGLHDSNDILIKSVIDAWILSN